MKQLFVHVNVDNKPAQELYKKTGFKVGTWTMQTWPYIYMLALAQRHTIKSVASIILLFFLYCNLFLKVLGYTFRKALISLLICYVDLHVWMVVVSPSISCSILVKFDFVHIFLWWVVVVAAYMLRGWLYKVKRIPQVSIVKILQKSQALYILCTSCCSLQYTPWIK